MAIPLGYRILIESRRISLDIAEVAVVIGRVYDSSGNNLSGVQISDPNPSQFPNNPGAITTVINANIGGSFPVVRSVLIISGLTSTWGFHKDITVDILDFQGVAHSVTRSVVIPSYYNRVEVISGPLPGLGLTNANMLLSGPSYIGESFGNPIGADIYKAVHINTLLPTSGTSSDGPEQAVTNSVALYTYHGYVQGTLSVGSYTTHELETFISNNLDPGFVTLGTFGSGALTFSYQDLENMTTGAGSSNPSVSSYEFTTHDVVLTHVISLAYLQDNSAPSQPQYIYDVCDNTDTADCQGNTIPVNHRAPSGSDYVGGRVTFNINQCCPVSCADFAVYTGTSPKNGWSNSGEIIVTPTGGLAPYSYALTPAPPLQTNPSATQDDTTCDTTLGSNIIDCDSNTVIAPGMDVSGAGIPTGAWVLWVNVPGAVTQFSIATGVASFPTTALATATATNITATFTPGAFHVFGGLIATTYSILVSDSNTTACTSTSAMTVNATTYATGCTNSAAQNYDDEATADCNGDIILDPDYTQATDWDSCCIAQVSGCTDTNAINYNSLATLDDGTCAYPTPGCTDPTASNYDSTFDIDDGSCVYPAASCIPDSIDTLIDKVGDCLDYKGDKALIQIKTGLIDDCSTSTAWTLILIHYLLSKKGLPCVYNCQDYETQDPLTNNTYTADYLENFINFVNKNCDSCFGTNDNNAGIVSSGGGMALPQSGLTIGGKIITINGITLNI
jgi:hypothetical protein